VSLTRGARRRDDAHLRRVGAEVDEAVRRALAYVLRSTQAKPQSEAEVRAKLTRRGVGGATADAVLAQARRLGAGDDAALARALVDERGVRRGYGVARVRAELEQRRLPGEAIEAALALLDGRDEEAAARDLAERRRAQLPADLEPEAVARRLAGYLARRGHPPALAQRVALQVSTLDRHWD
jgi:regulatory protein